MKNGLFIESDRSGLYNVLQARALYAARTDKEKDVWQIQITYPGDSSPTSLLQNVTKDVAGQFLESVKSAIAEAGVGLILCDKDWGFYLEGGADDTEKTTDDHAVSKALDRQMDTAVQHDNAREAAKAKAANGESAAADAESGEKAEGFSW